jgi:dUTP pyrophosphatase
MDNVKLLVRKLDDNAIIPTRGSERSSGLDLYALEDTSIGAGKTVLVRTGISFLIPEGYEIQVRPRSGLSLKTGLIVKNAPGTVDQDYTGECAVVMHFLVGRGEMEYQIKKGDRIAQAVLCPVIIPELVEVDNFWTRTARGENGFGSTDK